MKQVFVLSHVVLLPPEFEQEREKWVGIYSSEAEALAAIERLKTKPGFSDHPNLMDYNAEHPDFQGFGIDAYDLDQDYWPNGYDIHADE